MVTQQLIDYIKASLSQGISKEEIKNALLSRNWPIEDIELAFKMVADSTTGPMGSIPPQSSAISSNKLLSFGELFRKSIDLYKKKFLTLIGIAAIPELATILLGTLLQGNPSFSATANLIILFVAWLFIVVLNLLTSITIISALKEDKISIIQAYRNGLANILNAIWVNILFFSIVFGIPSVFIMLGLIVNSMLIPCLILSALLALIPGVIFMMWFIFSNYVLVVENTKGMKALLRSEGYAKGQVNKIFSRLFIVTLIFIILTTAVSLITEIIGGPLKIAFLEKIFNWIIATLSITFPLTFTYLLYLNVKELKGGQVSSENQRKEKMYWALAIVGLIMLIILPFKAIPLVLSELNSMQDEMLEMEIMGDMVNLKVAVNYYERMKGKYPNSLDELFAAYPNLFSRKPIDPITKKPYHYELLNNGSDFKICSGFGTPRENCITGNE